MADSSAYGLHDFAAALNRLDAELRKLEGRVWALDTPIYRESLMRQLDGVKRRARRIIGDGDAKGTK